MSFFAGHMQPGALAESAKRPKPEAASGSSESESEKEQSKSQSSSNEDEPLDFNSIEFLNSFSENAVNVLLKATMSEFSYKVSAAVLEQRVICFDTELFEVEREELNTDRCLPSDL